MFKVYETEEERISLLKSLFKIDACVGYLIAFANFEWTLKRAIFALGVSPTKVIKDERFKNDNGFYTSGINGYVEIWKVEVTPREKTSLKTFLDKQCSDFVKRISNETGTDIKSPAEILPKAFKLRAELIHGVRGSMSEKRAKFMFDYINQCSHVLVQLCNDRQCPVYGKRLCRYKDRTI